MKSVKKVLLWVFIAIVLAVVSWLLFLLKKGAL